MKTRTNSFKKLVSTLLCCSIVMQLGWQLGTNTVNAATTLGVSNGVVTLTADSSSDVSIVADGDGYKISSEDFADETVNTISKIVIEGPVNLYIRADLETSLEMGAAASQVFIEPGYTVKWSGFSAVGGTLYNEGTMEFNEFIITDIVGYTADSAFSLSNSGTIKADVISFYHEPFGFSSSPSAKYIASTSFEGGDNDLQGTVIANRSTLISSSYGSFTLEVDGAVQTFSGTEFDSKSAYTLFKDPGVDFSETVPNIYVGQTHDDFKTYFYTLQGYEGEIFVEFKGFSEDDSAYTTEEPTAAGTYYIRATAPSYGAYLEDHSTAQLFNIEYLDVSNQFEDGNYFTFGNLVDGKYVNGQVKVVPISSDYQISFAGSDFADYAMVSEEDVLINGEIPFPYVMFKLKDKDSGAETGNLYVANTMSANFEDLVFDTDEPYFFINDEEPYPVEDGDVIMAYNPAITVEDSTLVSVTDGEKTYTEINGNDDGKLETSISFTTTPGTSQVVTLTATDKFNKTTTITVTLKSPDLGDVSVAVSVPEGIHVGDVYEPTVTVTGTDEPYSLELLYDGEEDEMPTSAGTHTVVANAIFEEYETTVSSQAVTYTISKLSSEPSVSVTDITVGGTISPVLSGIPDDYGSLAGVVYEYKSSAAPEEAYSASVPSAVGSYMVRATIPATDKYEEATCEDTFTISKKTLTASVSVEDIIAGNTPSPVLTKPDDYDGNITYEYKLSSSDDDSYTTEVPSSGGDYTVRATLASTAAYQGTTCTDRFTISKIPVTATVEIDNCPPYYPYGPYLGTDPRGYDGNVIYEYKLSTDPDTSYTTTRPSAVGTYSVRATLEPTDIYEGTTCENTFTIFKVTVDAEIYTDDIELGDSPDVDVETTSSHYNGHITYEYKLSSEPDSAYTTDKPAAAGRYNVRATLPETDMYYGTTLTGSFTVEKASNYAYVTVRDIYVGEAVSPDFESDLGWYDGTPIYEYKLSTDSDTSYSTSVPTAAGTYTVRVTLPETANFESDTDTDTFTISRKQAVATVIVADTYVNSLIEPEISVESIDYVGDIDAAIIEYKLSTAEDNAYSTTAPTAAGTYTVRATLPETDIYESPVCTTTFTINKHEPTNSIIASDIYVGDSPDVALTGNIMTRTDLIYEYKLVSAPDTSYTLDEPITFGTYNVRVTAPETDYYKKGIFTDTFEISKHPCVVDVTAYEIKAGEEPNLDIETNSDGLDLATYEYREYSESVFKEGYPTEAGYYVIKVTIPETDKYLEGSGTCEMQVNRNEVTATISVADIYVGETPVPVITSESPAKNQATIEYKLKSAPESAYSATVPTTAGEYSIRASIPFTTFYKAVTCESTFTIMKKDISATVSVADIIYGETITPVVTLNSEDYEGMDQVYYVYAPYDPENPQEFTEEVPTTVGDYAVMAVFPATDTYNRAEIFANFSINKVPASVTVSVEDYYVGETMHRDFELTNKKTNSQYFFPFNEYIYYEYKPFDAPDTEYSETEPTAAGTYTIRLTVLPNNYCEDGTATDTFTINKHVTTAAVSVNDIIVGGTISPVITTNSDGKADTVIEYKLTTVPESAFSTAVPTAAGTYDVRATVPETFAYAGATAYAAFTISKNSATAEVSVANITVGNKPEPVVTTVSNGKADATFEYKAADADVSEYSETIPTAAGTYSIRANIPATAEYLSITCSSEFTISLNKVSVMNLTVEDVYYGQTVTPVFKTDSDGSVTIMYKLTVAPDSAYSATVPTATGDYTARAVVSETAVYESAVCYTEFSISYLEAPQVAYNPTGTSGKEGYFTSDVQLAAPEGYTISATSDGEYSNSIPYTEELDKIYLRRDDGALTSAITINEKPRIDKSAPSITASVGPIATGSVIYVSDMNVTISDPNLKSLTVNDEPIDLKPGTSNVITLSPGYGIKTFVITAEDIAGNVTTIEFTLKAKWLEDKIILPDVVLPLFSEESYNLDDGRWIVTKNTTSGTVKDTTVYNSDLPVYVNEDGDYTFTKVI